MTHFLYKINDLSVISKASGISLTKVYPHESDLYCNLSFFVVVVFLSCNDIYIRFWLK